MQEFDLMSGAARMEAGKILVVTTDRNLGDAVLRDGRQRGRQVLVAPAGEQARAALQQDPQDLIIVYLGAVPDSLA